jgi:CheY-specific phosphatase CheX
MQQSNSSLEMPPGQPKLEWVGSEAVTHMAMEQSLVCMRQQSGKETFALVDASQTGPVYHHWLGVILLAGTPLRITLKTFFSSRTVSSIMAPRLKMRPEEVNPSLTHDFMREYENRLAGSIKRILGEADINLGISLPLVTRGFDEVFSKSSPSETRSQWSLQEGERTFTLSMGITVLDGETVGRYQFVPSNTCPQEDEMEFL